jgi:hypothetical protein
MADISKLSRLIAGVQRQVDLASNTLVVGNTKIGGATNYLTFNVSAVTGEKTITMPNANVDLGALLSTALASGYILVGNGSGVATAVAMSGDVGIANTGATTIAANAVGAGKMRLENNTALRARNAANDGDVNILKVNASDIPEFSQFPITPSAAPDADYEVSNKKYVDDQVDAHVVGAFIYKGVFDASAGNFTAIVNPKQGWLYKVSVAGTIDTVLYSIGDNMYINKDVTGSPVTADIDKIDNTEASDILRNSMLASTQMFVGNGSGIATPVSMSSEATMSNAGAVTLSNAAVIGKLLTGFAAAAGTVADTDSILAALQKIVGNINAIVTDQTVKVMVAGEAFSQDVTYAVRMAKSGETDTRVYKADLDATTADNFHVIGLIRPTAAIAAGDNVNVMMLGEIVSSVAFTAVQDEGLPVFLSAAGLLTVTAPTTTNYAVVKVGSVSKCGAAGTAKILVQGIQVLGVN